jgi:predicted ATP-binding protein involved in virulence
MNITRLILHDYRCFKYLSIDFHPQLTVLVANNGGGKTSILDAVAVAFGEYVGMFDETLTPKDIANKNNIRVSSIDHNISADIVSFIKINECWGIVKRPLSIQDRGVYYYGYEYERLLKQIISTKHSERDALLAQLYKVDTYLGADKEVILPLMSYYRTNRLWKKIDVNNELLDVTASRTTGYKDCFTNDGQYTLLTEWFKYWTQASFASYRAASRRGEPSQRTEFDDYLDNIRNALTTCLEATGWYEIDFDFIKNTIIATHKDYGTLAISQLSDGIRTMIGLVADIAFRATKLNGHLGTEAVVKTSGIVLIDEIDMHLHPEWQQTVLQGFTKAFPLIQFIVTTHSPQVLSTVRKENIRVIEAIGEIGDGIYEANMPEFSPLAHPSSDALALIMDVFPTPDLLEDDLQQYEQYVLNNQEDSLIAQEIRKRLDDVGYEFHESDLSKWRFIASRKKANGV